MEILKQIPLVTTNSRYDLFEFTEGVEITFPTLGDYMYQVYQVPNDETLNPADGVLVEVGKLEVEDSSTLYTAFDATLTTIAYEPS